MGNLSISKMIDQQITEEKERQQAIYNTLKENGEYENDFMKVKFFQYDTGQNIAVLEGKKFLNYQNTSIHIHTHEGLFNPINQLATLIDFIEYTHKK